MSQTLPSPVRFDPYQNFKFRLQWDGREIPAVRNITPVNDAASSTLTVERDLTADTSLKDWLDTVVNSLQQAEGEIDPELLCKDIQIEQVGESGKVLAAWIVRDCRPTEYRAHPLGTAQGENASCERLVLEHSGWKPV